MVKVAPLGGVARLLDIAGRIDIPIVVSSALDSAVGMSRGLLAAACLPELRYACGLGTGGLFVEDVTEGIVTGRRPVARRSRRSRPGAAVGLGGSARPAGLVDRANQGLPPTAVLISGVHGMDATVPAVDTEPVKRSVVIAGFHGVQALDLVGPFEVFTGATQCLAGQGRPDDGYEVTIAAANGHSISTGTGLEIVATALPDPGVAVDTVVLPGGFGTEAARRDEALIEWITAVAENARRVVSVCTGAVLAAQAGLLDGCRATTHWAFAQQFADEFPSVTVDPEPIFLRSSTKTWTAAGVTAGIDLALALAEDDYGTDVAQTVARYLVLYLRRPGRQRSSPPRYGCRGPVAPRSGRFRRPSRVNPAARTACPISPAVPP